MGGSFRRSAVHVCGISTATRAWQDGGAIYGRPCHTRYYMCKVPAKTPQYRGSTSRRRGSLQGISTCTVASRKGLLVCIVSGVMQQRQQALQPKISVVHIRRTNFKPARLMCAGSSMLEKEKVQETRVVAGCESPYLSLTNRSPLHAVIHAVAPGQRTGLSFSSNKRLSRANFPIITFGGAFFGSTLLTLSRSPRFHLAGEDRPGAGRGGGTGVDRDNGGKCADRC